MKKQTKTLMLNKKTISNLTALGMSKLVGGNSMTCTDSCPISKCHYCGAILKMETLAPATKHVKPAKVFKSELALQNTGAKKI